VLLHSGISMTNAAMNTQLVLDRFKVTHIVYSGIAGGVNPALHIGDVTVPQRWGQYLEVLVARETAPGTFTPPVWMDDVKLPRFGANHPRPVEVRSAAQPKEHKKFWFDVDPTLLNLARSIQGTALADCDAARKCLGHKPKVVVGGNGVSGPAFVDNAAFRDYTFKTFEANVLDMETAATAQVAYSNGVPYIAFRSLSDLAGGGAHFHMDVAPDAETVLARTASSYGLNQSGTLLEGIALWGELKPLLTAEALIERALTYCDWAVAKGLLAIRSHVDTSDPRLLPVEALLEVKRRVAPYLDLQLVAFPAGRCAAHPWWSGQPEARAGPGRGRGGRHPALRAHHASEGAERQAAVRAGRRTGPR
jgi:nucleoside phosphorylase